MQPLSGYSLHKIVLDCEMNVFLLAVAVAPRLWESSGEGGGVIAEVCCVYALCIYLFEVMYTMCLRRKQQLIPVTQQRGGGVKTLMNGCVFLRSLLQCGAAAIIGAP